MNVASLDTDLLSALCNAVRSFKDIPPKERAAFLEALLRQADVVRRCDIERLVCAACASKRRGHGSDHTSTMYRHGQRGRLRTYRLCHKMFYDLSEVDALPPVGELPSRGLGKVSPMRR